MDGGHLCGLGIPIVMAEGCYIVKIGNIWAIYGGKLANGENGLHHELLGVVGGHLFGLGIPIVIAEGLYLVKKWRILVFFEKSSLFWVLRLAFRIE